MKTSRFLKYSNDRCCQPFRLLLTALTLLRMAAVATQMELVDQTGHESAVLGVVDEVCAIPEAGLAPGASARPVPPWHACSLALLLVLTSAARPGISWARGCSRWASDGCDVLGPWMCGWVQRCASGRHQ